MSLMDTIRNMVCEDSGTVPEIHTSPEPSDPKDAVGNYVRLGGTSFDIEGGVGGWELRKLGTPDVGFHENGAAHTQMITEHGAKLDTLVKPGHVLVIPRSSWRDTGKEVNHD